MIVFTQSVDGVDRRFLQVKVDVFWHSERLVLSILSSTDTQREELCRTGEYM